MKIVADRNIPFVREAFSPFGDVAALAVSEITQESVRSADILIVRSETRVDRSLLHGSSVRFVATVTIGIDHLDTGYLRSEGIPYASAPGSNASSVKEYVVAALLLLAATHGFRLKGKTLGVVGVGNIGTKVAAAARGLGMDVLENDPPLARLTGDRRYVPLGRLMECDVITLHVPLTTEGTDPTYHLFDEARFRAMKPGMVFFNTSRGAVAETVSLMNAIRTRRCPLAVIDVWENEPAIDLELLRLATLGTAHIAGYSMDGKLNAVRIVREAIRRHLSAPEDGWDPFALLAKPGPVSIRAAESPATAEEALHAAVAQCYDIGLDDRLLRQVLSLKTAGERSAHFRNLRAKYRLRREFSAVELQHNLPALEEKFRAIGFNRIITNN